MSFSKVKKSAYNSVAKGFSTVEKAFNVTDTSLTIVDDFLQEVLDVRNSSKEMRVELKMKNSIRDIITDSNESKLEFYKAIKDQEEKLNELKESLSSESLEKYKDLL